MEEINAQLSNLEHDIEEKRLHLSGVPAMGTSPSTSTDSVFLPLSTPPTVRTFPHSTQSIPAAPVSPSITSNLKSRLIKFSKTKLSFSSADNMAKNRTTNSMKNRSAKENKESNAASLRHTWSSDRFKQPKDTFHVSASLPTKSRIPRSPVSPRPRSPRLSPDFPRRRESDLSVDSSTLQLLASQQRPSSPRHRGPPNVGATTEEKIKVVQFVR